MNLATEQKETHRCRRKEIIKIRAEIKEKQRKPQKRSMKRKAVCMETNTNG